jgi:hypothetical protein
MKIIFSIKIFIIIEFYLKKTIWKLNEKKYIIY